MNLLQQLQLADNESVVQHTLLGVIQSYFNADKVSFAYKTDGIIKLDRKNNYLLCEFKYDEDFSSKEAKAKVILQSVFYMKKIELDGGICPSVLLVADKNEAFILHTNRLHKYLSLELDWSVAASTAWSKFPNVISEMVKDDELMNRIWVDDLNSEYKILNIPTMIERAASRDRKVRIHPKNIHVIFDDFKEKVLLDWKSVGANRAVGVFMSCLLDTENNDLHRRNNNTFIWYNPLKKTDERIEVKGDRFDAFWSHFDREQYSITEKERLVAMSDEIIEETNRRFKGEYYTPSIWVDEAHKEMAKVYGENWKDEYVVWDCACGTGNLTRGYEFKELYMSTLNESDLIQAGYGNEGAVKFQFDFLNDDDDKLPEELRKALKEGKVIFLMNPPYGTAGGGATGGGESKTSISKTKIGSLMTNEKLSNASEQLYAQFLYKISFYHEAKIGMFSPSLFMTGDSYKEFREKVLIKLDYKYGMLFQASHFADVKSNWGISFTIWSKKGEETVCLK